MLSPHEFATLMLIRHAPEQIDMNRHELDILFERQLVALEQRAEGMRRLSLTSAGRSLLEALGRAEPRLAPYEESGSYDAH
ncbi:MULTISPECIES: hypothetical protein [Paraburkholderia]|uniref:hypothetical protein n=1 Tax=Paraburkholderia TaxID=1822464 RepID=UPI0007EC3E43|nr:MULTISPECIES: hypothetical protein [Paraburkholderia]MBB2980911.1 hypothetical protein [Paraburkholderia tropica]OBR47678.1 hypothetical protein A6456_28810 [Paraburkholderia tropica]QNB16576.1 hypothetical protein G5S35_33830 [Paraburkholderia tropica]RQM46856.1 hypothetical protein EHZ19_16595 [Paraburkholderia bannensis]